ncbi:MAG: hypothetical protein CMK07_09805 [Ponticaulis sp.]|nr:hypothetical protein [Ponticaulis sp.]
MAFVFLIYSPDGADVDREQLNRIRDWVSDLRAAGKLIFQTPFLPPGAANHVHRDMGEAETVDGPVSDELLSIHGAEFVKCADMDEALELAGRHPVHNIPGARVEVRKTWNVEKI